LHNLVVKLVLVTCETKKTRTRIEKMRGREKIETYSIIM